MVEDTIFHLKPEHSPCDILIEGVINLISKGDSETTAGCDCEGKTCEQSNDICVAPGMCDAMCVASETGSRPHIISVTKKGSLACDEACIAWQSQKFCSHVLAVAENKNCLGDYLTSYRRSKVKGNYTAVCMHSQAKGIGK